MRSRAGAALCLLFLLIGCDPGPPKPPHVQIDLAWDTAGAVLGSGLGTITNDTGYVIELDRLAVTTYSVELMPCDAATPPQKTTFSFIGTAWAGHQAGHPPTRTNLAGLEAPLTAATATMDKITPPDGTYCGAHFLLARLLDPPAGAKPEDTVGFTLRMHGRYRKADQDVWTPLTLETAAAHGVLADFEPKAGVRFKDGDTVVVTRRLAGMFNGVDFAAMDGQAATRQILRQLVAGTTVTWHHSPPV